MWGHALHARTPVKRAVALAIPRPADPSQVLVVLRPDDDEDLPGIWGLPAASLRPGETEEQGAVRVGQQKLALAVRLGRRLSQGAQVRGSETLTMSVFQASISGEPVIPPLVDTDPGVTFYTSWRWAGPEALEEGARRGSLCCQLFLKFRQGM